MTGDRDLEIFGGEGSGAKTGSLVVIICSACIAACIARVGRGVGMT